MTFDREQILKMKHGINEIRSYKREIRSRKFTPNSCAFSGIVDSPAEMAILLFHLFGLSLNFVNFGFQSNPEEFSGPLGPSEV